MSGSWYFFHQNRGKEDTWTMALASDREKVSLLQPAFSTVLDLSSVPEDNDWTKVRYRGPFYADFDAGDDLPLVCEQFKLFLGKLDGDLSFDITQARLYASGSKGFHVEIPQECFMPKVPPAGTPWLAYMYREMAQSLMVDTLDLNVYTGKRGRQWRTPNVKRENGMYKVPLTLEEALSMDEGLYRDLIQAPREVPERTPAQVNSLFSVLFERSRDKVTKQMRTKKKRQLQASAVLNPWRKAKQTPPSIESIMAGENLNPDAGFQAIAMQLSIYAVSVEMPLPEFIDRCKGLIEHHVSDGSRYNTAIKRREELARMWSYMAENSLYDFEVGPIARLLKHGTNVADLGVVDTVDRDDEPTASSSTSVTDSDDGDEPQMQEAVVNLDVHKGLRRGFYMNADGMFRKAGDLVDPISRATLRKVDAFHDVEKRVFSGYEFDIFVGGKKRRREMLSAEGFTSAAALKKFFAAHQISFQGTDADAAALFDIMTEKAERGGKVYVYPREGFMVLNNPEHDTPTPTMVFLTKDSFLCSVKEGEPDYFRLKYRASSVTSAYDIDVQWAPDLDDTFIPAIEDLFVMNKPSIVADCLGWMVACHYRSVYLRLFHQFPMLQAYGEAGSGKSQTVKLLAHLHWYITDRIPIKSAMSFTPFAMDAHASSSTSAPFMIDEYKPRELRSAKGKFEKLKDVFKASYIGSDIGERGTINRGAENNLALIKSKACAPICFMGEAIEMETAIIERSVCVPFTKATHTPEREASFLALQRDPSALSAIGRAVIEAGFGINLEAMRTEVRELQRQIEESLPEFNDKDRKRLAPRLIYNRAVVIHGLMTLKRVLARTFGDKFDESCDALIHAKSDSGEGEEGKALQIHGMSEISKVLSRIALLSRDVDAYYEMKMGKDYILGDGWVEIKVERSYDQYRRYCASIQDTPLFDNLDSFTHAMNNYSPCIDRICADSELRSDDSSEKVFRFSLSALRREQVQAFR